jgi:hypothetical protein
MKTVTILKVLNSSSVSGVAYSDGELFVKFTAGVIYKYTNVPEEVFTEVVKLVTLGNMGTKSPVGKFIQDHIKGIYQFEKVTLPSNEYDFILGQEENYGNL